MLAFIVVIVNQAEWAKRRNLETKPTNQGRIIKIEPGEGNLTYEGRKGRTKSKSFVRVQSQKPMRVPMTTMKANTYKRHDRPIRARDMIGQSLHEARRGPPVNKLHGCHGYALWPKCVSMATMRIVLCVCV